MDDSPIQRDGRWWHPLPDGGWALWDEGTNAWQPVDIAPPPPPLPGAAPAPAPSTLVGTVEAAVAVRQRAPRARDEARDPAPTPSRDDTWASVRVPAAGTAGATGSSTRGPVTPSNGRLVYFVIGGLVAVAAVLGALRTGLVGGTGMPSADDVAAAFVPVPGFRYGDAIPGAQEQIQRAYDETGGDDFGALEVRTLTRKGRGTDAVVAVVAVDPELASTSITEYASWVEAGAGMESAPIELHGFDGLELSGPRGSGGVVFADPDGLMFTVASPRLSDARRIATQLARAHG
ncbi:MAG TPA: hypothetical protein VHJ34_09055 [Actinomycetota bacterium]|nr:hypothetical protein [Actinomycetota bacterium]